MEIRLLRDGEQDACLDLWGAAFPGAGRAFFVKYFTRDETWRPGDTVVCVVDGAIVSGATFVRRTVRCGETRLTLGGVANVGTLPEFRSKGYSTAVLERLIAEMDAAGMDFSLLGTGITGFYARLGYAEWRRPYLAGKPAEAVDGAAPVRAATAADLPTIRAWYAAYNAGRPIAAERSESYWTDWLNLGPESVPDGLLVGDGGYVFVGHNEEKKQAYVREIGGEPGAIVGLLAAATRIAHERGAETLSWGVPLDPEIVAAAETLLTDRTDGEHGGLMWRAQRSPLPDVAAAARAAIWWGTDGF